MLKLDNSKHERFCHEYIIDHNGTQAAVRAGYSKKTANEQSSQILTILNVKERIKHLEQKSLERIDISADKVLQELGRIAFASMEDYVDIDEVTGSTHAKGYKDMPPGGGKVVRKIKEKRRILQSKGEKDDMILDDTYEFELHDKMKALEMLGKNYKLFTDNLNLTGFPKRIVIMNENGKKEEELG